MRAMRCAALAAAVVVAAAGAEAGVILVGGPRTEGKAAAAKSGAVWVKSLTKGFARAAREIGPGTAEVELRLAEGEYTGDLGSGAYAIPKMVNPKATLTVSGGWIDGFSRRDPFGHPSVILATPQRSAPLWTVERGSKLGALVIDGLVWDAAPSNAYDARSNSLLPGKSCSFKYIKFNYLETNRLAFRSCIFLNSPGRAIEPLIRAATPKATMEFFNCIFFNNRIPLKLDSARFRNRPAKISVERCSFLLNWPYNPDPATGNRGALEIGPQEAAGEITISRCLFWGNVGGAIQAGFTKLPALVIDNNDF
ncbi:MAG TPA: hypothetical protein ENK19_00870, partial [Acidobacteria bacterium]|nr:hypothetical protein [Acidobacteriota bacterium]